MASTYSTNLKIELIGTGEQAGTWGATTNTNLGTALEQAIVGKADVSMSSTTVTLTLTNSNSAQNARAIYLNLTGSPGGAAVLEVPAIEKPYIVKNGSDQQVTVKVSGQTGVAVPTGKTMWLYNDGTDVTNAITNLPAGTTVGGAAIGTGSGSVTSVDVSGGTTGLTTSGGPITGSGTITLAGTLAVANGGTGQTGTPTNGELLIGNGSGFTKSTITAGSGITVTNGSGSITIASTGGGGGTVTSVSGTGNVNGITLSGTVTTSGSLTLGGTLSNVSLSSQVTGTLPVANGGTGATSLSSAGIVTTTGTQTISGAKTFSSEITATDGMSINVDATNSGLLFYEGGSNTGYGITASAGYLLLGYIGQNRILFIGQSTVDDPGIEFTNGNVYKPGGGSFLSSSDVRNKTDINNYLKGLDDLDALRPVSFKYSGDLGDQTGHKTFIGLIAQEVQETPFADMVSEKPDGYLSLDSSQLVYALVNAVKELKSELDLVKVELAALKN